MSAVDALAILCGLIGVGLWLAMWHIRSFGRVHGPWIALTGLFLFAMPIAWFGERSIQSIYDLLNQEAFVVIVSAAFVLGGMALRSMPGRKIVALMSIVMGTIGILLGGWRLAGDFLLPRHYIEGVAERAFARGSRLSKSYHVSIDGREYAAHRDAFGTIRVNQRVRVEIGAGSGRVFRMEPIAN